MSRKFLTNFFKNIFIKNIFINSFFILTFVFNTQNAFALQIISVNSDTNKNWFEIYNDGDDIANFANSTLYKVYENSNSHAIKTVSQNQDTTFHKNESAFIVDSTSTFFMNNPNYAGIFFDSSFDLLNSNSYVAISDSNITNRVYYACKSYGSGICPNTSSTTPTISDSAPTSTNPAASSSIVYIYVPQNNQNKYGDINVLLPTERVAPAGADTDFTVKVTDSQKNVLSGLDFSWSFGDGGEKFGKDVTHHYTYPGEYTLIARADGWTSGAEARMNVTALKPDIQIVKVGTSSEENFIDIKNNTDYDMYLSNFYLNLDNNLYKLPKSFVIAKNKTVHLSGEAMNFKLPAINVSLLYPNKNVLTKYEMLIANSTHTLMMAQATSTIINTNTVATITNLTASPSKINVEIQATVNFTKPDLLQNQNQANLKTNVNKILPDFKEVKLLKRLVLKDGVTTSISQNTAPSPTLPKGKGETQTQKTKTVDTGVINWLKSLLY